MRYKIKERKEQRKLVQPDGWANSTVFHLSSEVTSVSQSTVRTLCISLTHSRVCDAKLSNCSKIALIISTSLLAHINRRGGCASCLITLLSFLRKIICEIHLAWLAVFISHANIMLPSGDICLCLAWRHCVKVWHSFALTAECGSVEQAEVELTSHVLAHLKN